MYLARLSGHFLFSKTLERLYNLHFRHKDKDVERYFVKEIERSFDEITICIYRITRVHFLKNKTIIATVAPEPRFFKYI